jgi:L-ascorbate metabolism protein UlaG (beta-lactamase superfamily)
LTVNNDKLMMKRRQLMRYVPMGVCAALATSLSAGTQPSRAQTSDSLSVQWLGHTCFLFAGGGQRVLVNPFKPLGCTAGYRPPNVAADLVLISSQLLDEGALEIVPGNPRLLYEAGVYQLGGKPIQGIQIAHDREGGRRFGINVVWKWTQGGINIVHLGGGAAPISIEQKILMGRPDLLLLPVGGGAKAYTPQEAKQAMQVLNPKMVIPTHYRTQAADANNCDISPVDEFLSLVNKASIRPINSDTMTLSPADLPAEGAAISVLSYKF